MKIIDLKQSHLEEACELFTAPEACQFWLKNFQPGCKSMVRRLDERV